MKVVPKVNTNGLYLEDELVDDAFSGVVPFYAQPDNDQDEETELKKPELIGYTVGIPITILGLYKPKFDLAAWKAYESAVYEAQEKYIAALNDWQANGRAAGEQPVYVAPKQPDNLWTEGLTPEQIAELTKPTEQLSELDQLRASNEAMQLAIAELTMMFASRGGETT
ncbi:hypothetical protein [Paenibacillus sp. FSL H8-0168]|uniref:hypothetical protein n=1 Tax=Paenibacillus sp. FSL H8-0168 TaxID=2921378 RepID=UPI0031588B0B